jgi:CRP-like cAMP-binding protein
MKPELFDSVQKIHQKLAKFSNIKIEELLIIQNIISLEEIKEGEFFLRPGDSAQKIGIITKGLTKAYYLMENGKEHISHFGSEGSFVGAYTDMLKDIPSTGYVQALETTTMVVMDYKELLNVTKNSLAWAHLLRVVAEDRYIYRSDKDRNITLRTAKEKYQYFLEKHPELENRLHQNQIALYLNINAATLSRLKNGSGKYKDK